jgi:hypothetical protein
MFSIMTRQKPCAPEFSPSSRNEKREEHRELPDLPQFDSLPATAGLDNVEAFRLSIRHALALLPTILGRDRKFATHSSNPERFSLR